MLGIVFTDLLKGIGMGIAVAVIVLLRRNFRNSHFLRSEGTDSETGKHHVHIRLSEEVTFLNKGSIIRELSEVPDGSKVVIDRSNIDIDHDVIEVIDDFKTNAPDRASRSRSSQASGGPKTASMDLSRFRRRRYTQHPTPIEHLRHFSQALGGPGGVDQAR